jgi:hypothetical protein
MRKTMTVTIGAICDANHQTQTGNVILDADTLISFTSAGTPVSSNVGGTKIYDLPHGFYVAIADDISRSHQVVSFLYNEIENLNPADPRLVDLIKLAVDRTAEYVRLWMRREVLAEYSVSLKEFLGKRRQIKRDEIANEVRNRVISTQLTIAGFGPKQNPILLFTDCVNTQEQTNPGFFCAGAGMGAALDWLNFRQQNCFMSMQRTWYHVREAKDYATVSPVVGNMNTTILIRPGKPFVNVSAVTPLFEDWMRKMYPRLTDGLDEPLRQQEFLAAYAIKP